MTGNSSRNMFRAIGLGCLLFGAQAANAQEVFEFLGDDECVDQGEPVSGERLRELAFADVSLALSPYLARVVSLGRLGDVAYDVYDQCKLGNGPCTVSIKDRPADPGKNNHLPGEKITFSENAVGSIYSLFERTKPLRRLGADPAKVSVPKGFEIKAGSVSLPQGYDAAVSFLNGDDSWLSVKCANKKSVQTPRPMDKKPLLDLGLIIAKSSEDGLKSKLSERDFATFGLTIDRKSNKTVGFVDLYIAPEGGIIGKDSELELGPYLALQYNSADAVDDLTLGGQARWYPGFGNHLFGGRVAWESDVRFRSSALRADAAWEPLAASRACERLGTDDDFLICSVKAVTDYQHVFDAGQKVALASTPEFFRVGADVNLTYGYRLGGDLGWLQMGSALSFRQDIAGNNADVLLYTASIGLLPGDGAHWKFGVDYTRGEDLSSLEFQDKIAFVLGLRW